VFMLNIKNPEADKLARLLAQQTGETITEVVIKALREKLIREQGKKAPVELKEALLAIGNRCAALPDRDPRSPDEIIGYDEYGLPKESSHQKITK
jgi:antitoxin VapB